MKIKQSSIVAVVECLFKRGAIFRMFLCKRWKYEKDNHGSVFPNDNPVISSFMYLNKSGTALFI